MDNNTLLRISVGVDEHFKTHNEKLLLQRVNIK